MQGEQTKVGLFQLTASQGGGQYLGEYAYIWIQHFNSQPHKEADLEIGQVLRGMIISTHSLTRRLTKCTQ